MPHGECPITSYTSQRRPPARSTPTRRPRRRHCSKAPSPSHTCSKTSPVGCAPERQRRIAAWCSDAVPFRSRHPCNSDGVAQAGILTHAGRAVTAEHVPASQAVGRVAAETISPYPPGVPVVAPGEVITREVVDYLTSGVAAGMLIPDAADPTAETLRVTAR